MTKFKVGDLVRVRLKQFKGAVGHIVNIVYIRRYPYQVQLNERIEHFAEDELEKVQPGEMPARLGDAQVVVICATILRCFPDDRVKKILEEAHLTQAQIDKAFGEAMAIINEAAARGKP